MFEEPAHVHVADPAASPFPYPLASRDDWYGEANFEANGGRLVLVDPAEYLAAVRVLVIDEISRENIDILKAHMAAGQPIDPLTLFKNGKEDGRHRAHAALELGISLVPVVVFGDYFPDAEPVVIEQHKDAQTDAGAHMTRHRSDVPRT